MAKIAELHTAWSLRYGDEVPYVAADEGAKPTDLAIWQADRSATAAQQDELNATIVAILADIDDTPEPTPAGNMRIIRIMGRPAGGLPFNIDVTQIDLSAVQAAWERQLSRVLDAWVSITGDQRRRIIEQVRAAVNADDLNAIAKISVSSTEAADLLTKAMNEMALIASQHMVTELNDQGLHAHPVPGHPDLHGSYAAATATLLAAGLANAGAREALRRYAPSASGDDVANAVGAHLDGLSDAFLRTNLGLALTAAQNDGRFATIKAAPEVALYASEVMDKNTCGPCRAVNGKWLGNNTQMDMVYATYPNGGYTECLGGPRCRGTVVAVYRPRQVDTNHPGPGEGGPQP
jgi:hypothetical protein